MTPNNQVARLESRYVAWSALMKRMLPSDVLRVLLDRDRFDRHLAAVMAHEADRAHLEGMRISRGRFS
jgi:hypothetical protein